MFGNFLPERTVVTIGPVAVHWYGLFAALAAVVAFFLGRLLARRANLPIDGFGDAFFLSLVAGVIGARLWHVVGDLGFYLDHPAEIPAIWNGGLALHGGLVAGGLSLLWFARRKRWSFLLLADLFAPLLGVAHAIGRWGNYFNQELFGRPTDLPWGIPIAPASRPAAFSEATHFHPIFLYESLGLAAVATLLTYWFLHRTRVGRAACFFEHGMLFAVYLAATGALRIGVEFLRTDPVPTLAGVRVPTLVALALTVAGLALFRSLLRRRGPAVPQSP